MKVNLAVANQDNTVQVPQCRQAVLIPSSVTSAMLIDNQYIEIVQPACVTFGPCAEGLSIEPFTVQGPGDNDIITVVWMA
ncbi:MAG TPA: hypothetical protein VMJ32_14435 [Pirellulales bacterium]|nr:hypothetical protein [Pirellulales bacterium]